MGLAEERDRSEISLPAMNLTRAFTFVGLALVLLAFVPVMMGRFWEAIYLLGFVVAAGVGIVLWNLRK